jgi:hypothetical protein
VASNVESVTLDILKTIQASIAQFRAETNERLDKLEAGLRRDRRNVAGILVMMRATAGDFDPARHRGRRTHHRSRDESAMTPPRMFEPDDNDGA